MQNISLITDTISWMFPDSTLIQQIQPVNLEPDPQPIR